MDFFKPSQKLTEDFAVQSDPKSDTRIDATRTRLPNFSGPIDILLAREAISERLEMFLGTLIHRRAMVCGTEIQLIVKGRFADEVRMGMLERLHLSSPNDVARYALLGRLAQEFKEWATGPEGRAFYAPWAEVEDDIGSLSLKWSIAFNEELLKPQLPPLPENG